MKEPTRSQELKKWPTERRRKGMTKFRKKKQLEPLTNVNIFKHFIDKKSVRFDFSPSKSQIFNKIRKVKAKFKSSKEFEDSNWANESSLLQLISMGLGKEVVRIGMGMIDFLEMEELKERWQQLCLSKLQLTSDKAMLMNL
ncbi:hypothetical protein ACJRO7_001291 [Eucalyptus globulus]|uniref:Uncharacterized protein n=1 Tax=Eucalyptus globulus TaxID=34317 RepID=A0ABD3LRG8_EUCGL